MNNLNKPNFFQPLAEKYPEAIEKFCQWVDRFKERNNWDILFGGGVVTGPKFHDLPYEMQYGILLSFFHAEQKLGFIDVTNTRKFFEDMFQCLQNGTSYYDQPVSAGMTMVGIERHQHISKHGYTADSDKKNNDGEMVKVAATILLNDKSHYPKWWNIAFIEYVAKKTQIEKLVVAASLIISEIDRLIDEEKLNESTGNNQSSTRETEAPAVNAE